MNVSVIFGKRDIMYATRGVEDASVVVDSGAEGMAAITRVFSSERNQIVGDKVAGCGCSSKALT